MTEYTDDRYTMEASERRAMALGCSILFPQKDELFIDIDSNDSFEVFCENFRLLKDARIIVGEPKVWPSKSGLPHRHIIVKVNSLVLARLDKITLQLILGSDRKHEMWSYLASVAGHPNPTLFFEKV